MYIYLYDDFIKKKKYDSLIKEIETQLTDFGIAGKILRLQPFTNTEKLIAEEIKKGATTVVIVGNDKTFGRVMSYAAYCKVYFGFIPVGPENTIAEVLGIPTGVDACHVLSRRRRVRLDVGWVNNRFFISYLHILPHAIRVAYDERFVVSTRGRNTMELVVCNLQPFRWKEKGGKDYVVHPQDGKLEAFLRPVKKTLLLQKKQFEEPSIFPFEEMLVVSDTPFTVEADGRQTKEKKIKISLAKKRLNIIVGRGRKF